MPRPPTLPGLPVLGSLLDMRRDRVGTLMRAAQLGDVVHLHFPKLEAVLLSHPDHVKRVLVDEYQSFGKQTRGYDALRIGLGNGLVTSEGSFWRRQRRIAQPAFHRRRIAGLVDTMTRASLDMVERWERRASLSLPIDVDAEMMAVTFRIVGECLLSTDISNDTHAVGKAVTTLLHELMERITRPLSLPLSVPTPKNRRMKAALQVLDDVVLEIIAQRRASQEEHDDLLAMLMNTEDAETGERMTDRQLRDEVITIVLAGHETTANAVTWAFYLLSKFPAVAQRLCAELDEVLPDRRAPTAEDLPRLVYTEAVFKEAMRLYPPVWVVARSVRQDITFDRYPVRKGQLVFISPYVLHHDRRFFDNPEGFEPERFLGDAKKTIPKLAYIPFIAGPRQCIGNTFAMVEAQLILATVLQRYRLSLVAGHPVEPTPMVTLRPKYGMKMHLTPRD